MNAGIAIIQRGGDYRDYCQGQHMAPVIVKFGEIPYSLVNVTFIKSLGIFDAETSKYQILPVLFAQYEQIP